MILSIQFEPGETYSYAPGDIVPVNFNNLAGRVTRINFKHV
jgi:hypothetical protein